MQCVISDWILDEKNDISETTEKNSSKVCTHSLTASHVNHYTEMIININILGSWVKGTLKFFVLFCFFW